MNDIQMIGETTAELLKRYLNKEDSNDGIARFLLDCLSGDQVTAICQAIAADAELSELCKIQIPRTLIAANALPEEMLTDEKTVRLRNMPCEKPALILANTNDDQGQSLKDITKIGAPEIIENVEVWVDIAAKSLSIPATQTAFWKKALHGLTRSTPATLDSFAKYIALTAERIRADRLPLIDALGWALPALRLPRDSGYFSSIPEKSWNQSRRWQDAFTQAFSKRGCLLRKENASRKIIEQEELEFSFERVKDQIPSDIHPAILEFIHSPSGWNLSSETLASYEWEIQNVNSIFSGLKTKKMNLSQETFKFFDEEYQDSLTEQDKQYLDSLSKRGTKESNEYDLAFYESHSHEIENHKVLKSKWDKFVFGQPIECTDFFEGLLRAIERLTAQSGGMTGEKQLTITTSKGKKQSLWLELNADIGLFFCTRYRGVQKLTNSSIKWETHWLFKYDELLEKASQDKKYKRNHQTSRSATEIKFLLELFVGAAESREKISVNLVWKCNPLAMGMELKDDLNRLSVTTHSSLLLSHVYREPTNKKGRIQGVSLKDVGTLAAVFRQDRGSLVGRYEKSNDLVKTIPEKLNAAKKSGVITSAGFDSLLNRWNEFVSAYKEAIKDFLFGDGIASGSLLTQADCYSSFLTALTEEAKGDTNRTNLYEPVLEIGCVKIGGGEPAALIAPWHPLRFASIAVKARQVIGLINHVLSSETIEFGDSRLFFSDLRNELEHPYYPEVCIGYQNKQPLLLTISDTVNDYSLMEQPIRLKDAATTNEDPGTAASQLIRLTERYLELLPHEQTNLSIVLYNCDSIKLPQAVVSKLADLHDEMNDARCRVILRHTDQKKLGDLYQQLVGNSENDPDAFIASEASKDFIARLRIGVKAEATDSSQSGLEGKTADIVFLQDVVARQATLDWVKVPDNMQQPEVLEHVPSRWSKKKPANFDDLKSTVYLTCPIQPSIGTGYLNAIYSAVKNEDLTPGHGYLPARQISFKDDQTQKILEDVHHLGEWVANYDELIEKRQLMNQGIRVIRYQQNRTSELNFLVSSTSKLNLLNVLVKRRLDALALGFAEEEVKDLASRLIEEANGLSGDIVLRAAKSGRFASELVGVALSKLLINEEFKNAEAVGWFFLDDYATWLGQKEEQIADILGVALRRANDKVYLQLIISEAKFVDSEGVADAKKTSQKQLRDTVDRIAQALFCTPGRLDRDLWLSRIGDLLINGIALPPASKFTLEGWHEQLRSGQLELELRGYSHVFVSGSNESEIDCESSAVAKIDNCWQEVFNREAVRDLLKSYSKKNTLFKVREKVSPNKQWEATFPRLPAARVNWVKSAAPSKVVLSDQRVEAEHDPYSVNPLNEIRNDVAVKPRQETYTHDLKAPNESLSLDKQPASANSTHFAENDGAGHPKQPLNVDLRTSTADSVANHLQPPEETSYAQASDTQPSTIENWMRQSKSMPQDESKALLWLEQVATTLSMALLSYNLHAKILGKRLTPNAGLIRLKGSDRLTIEDIERRTSQFLTTHGLSIIGIFAQPGEILLYVARPSRQMVPLRELLLTRKLNRDEAGVNMSFLIGVKELDGDILYLNLARAFEGNQQHAPHTLIAGSTGSGKSVLLQNLLLDICITNSPSQAHIYLIDPKAGVDYVHLESLPHMTHGIIVEQKKATQVMEALVEEMDRRYLMFREHKAKDLTSYNMKSLPENRLPVIFLVHDEFAEWMLVEEYKDAVSSIVQRLGVKARAAGIHLIFAAQRPDANVLPVQLRDNLGNRLILRVESIGTSEIALMQKGAERLLGKGHLAARLSGEPDIIYAQVPFLSDSELQELTNHLTPKAV